MDRNDTLVNNQDRMNIVISVQFTYIPETNSVS